MAWTPKQEKKVYEKRDGEKKRLTIFQLSGGEAGSLWSGPVNRVGEGTVTSCRNCRHLRLPTVERRTTGSYKVTWKRIGGVVTAIDKFDTHLLRLFE